MTMAIGKRSALTAIMVFLTLGETGSVEQELPWGSQAFFGGHSEDTQNGKSYS